MSYPDLFDRDGAVMAARKGGLVPDEARYLDSAEGENTFLSAIGFQDAGKARNSKPNVKSGPWPQPQQATRPQQTVRAQQVNQSTNIKASPGHNTKPQIRNVPVNTSWDSHAQYQGQPQGDLSQWGQTTTQPAPLASNYWARQRVAKGIADPSAYPSAYPNAGTQAAWNTATPPAWDTVAQRPDRNPEASTSCPNNSTNTNPSWRKKRKGKGHGGNQWWGATAPQSPDNRASPRQYRGRSAKRRSPAQPNRGKPTNHPAAQQPPAVPCANMDADDWPSYNSKKRTPIPDEDYAGSQYSLPSLGSGFNISVNGVESTDNSVADIRNTIGLPHNIHQAGNTWTKCNWNDNYGKDYDETFKMSHYLGAFIDAWIMAVPGGVKASLEQDVDEHWRCDIDTTTGRLVPPVDYPDSMVDLSQIKEKLEWRRQTWTAALMMQRHCPEPRQQHHKGKGNRGRSRRNRRGQSHSRIRDHRPTFITDEYSVKIEDPAITRPEFHRFVPGVPCFLRPAEKVDMEAARLIYNWEVENGLQALDSQPLSVEDFKKILTTTQELGMPFIVAVRGSARDLGLTQGNLVYSVFDQIPFYEGNQRGEVLGFAYLSVWQPGLAGSGHGSSRATAKINVFVHPDYRRRKIGFSLMDMLLTTVSDCFSSQTAHDFVDPDDSPVYRNNKNSSARERRYYRLYCTYRVKHKHITDGNKKLEEEQKKYDEDLVWVKRMLEDQMNFTELVRFEAVHRSAKDREGEVCWLDEVVFEHTCLFDPRNVKGDY